jgi:hypothetical protein
VYGITDKGETRLRELLVNADPSDDRAFHVQVAFCHFLEPVARLGLFERRRAHLTTELAKRRRPSDTPTTDPYLRSLKERDITTLTDDLGWLDELTRITQEQLVPAPSPNRSSPPQEAPTHEQDPLGNRRRRQLRQLSRPRARVLQGRRPV